MAHIHKGKALKGREIHIGYRELQVIPMSDDPNSTVFVLYIARTNQMCRNTIVYYSMCSIYCYMNSPVHSFKLR